MRPNSIVLFERLYLGSLVVGVVNLVLSYERIVAQMQSDPAVAQLGWGAGAVIVMFSLGMAVSLVLWYFIARRGSSIAKWFLVAFTAIGLLSLPTTLATATGPALIMAVVINLMQLVAVVMLFRADAKPWFDHSASTPAGTPADTPADLSKFD